MRIIKLKILRNYLCFMIFMTFCLKSNAIDCPPRCGSCSTVNQTTVCDACIEGYFLNNNTKWKEYIFSS